ncbi:hypothetical protein ABIC60_003616 [Phyllobacterium ifriqiyense]
MQTLAKPIICHECRAIFTEIIIEEFLDSPVHCRLCGACICFWKDIIAAHLPDKRDGQEP